jgi:hypothetical protein
MPSASHPSTADRAEWLTPRCFAALLAALVIVAFPQIIFGTQTLAYRDFGVFSYPAAFHFRESFWRGEWPLWNPLNCCGVPFLAQWSTQVLYPPALFYLVLPLSWSLGVFCLLHLYWGGLGMFLLAQRWTGQRLAAAFAGIVFAFSGLMLSGLVWPENVAALGWMPWVVGYTERAWREGGRTTLLAAILGGLQMLSGGVEVVLLTWFWLGALWLAEGWRGQIPRARLLMRAGVVAGLIAGLAAAQLLPFFQLLDDSRTQQNITAALWSMPATGWANFLTPLFHAHAFQGAFLQDNQLWLNSYYVGAATIALALAALWLARRRWLVWLMAGLTLLFLVLALGDATPVYGWLARHGSFIGLMRYPIKFVMLPVFLLPLIAALALAEILSQPDSVAVRRLLAGLGLASLAAVLGLTFWPWHFDTANPDRSAILVNGLQRAFFLIAIFAVWLGRKPLSRADPRLWQLLFLLLVWFDLFHQMPLPKTVNRETYAPGLARTWSAPQSGAARVRLSSVAYEAVAHHVLADPTADLLGRRFALRANCNLLDDIPECEGFYSLFVNRYAMLFYNFYRDDQPAESLLDFLGVSQTLVLRDGRLDWQARNTFLPLLTAGQRPRFGDDYAALHRLTNADFNPRLEVTLPLAAQPFITASNAVAAQLGAVTCASQRIESQLVAPEPTLVVAAQMYYPNWQAFVDGQPVRLWPANYAFQAFEVPAGTHQIKLMYVDRRFHWGLAISLATLAVCLIGMAWPQFAGRKKSGV